MKTFLVPAREDATKLKRTIFDKPRQGVECMYVQLTKKVGMKIYATKGRAERSRKRQLKAYAFAPKVLSEVQKCLMGNLLSYDKEGIFRNSYDNHSKYGFFFLTQVAETHVRHTDKELDQLANNMRRIKLGYEDLHYNNIGRIGKKLVVIDFGDEST